MRTASGQRREDNPMGERLWGLAHLSCLRCADAAGSIPEATSRDLVAQPALLGGAAQSRIETAKVRRMRHGMVSTGAAMPIMLVTQIHLDAAQRPWPGQFVGGLSSVILPRFRGRCTLQRCRGRTRGGSAPAHQL